MTRRMRCRLSAASASIWQFRMRWRPPTYLARPLSQNYVSLSHLQKVQWRREFPTKVTQWGQVQVQERILKPVLGSRQRVRAPWFLRLFKRFPILRRIPARLIRNWREA